jgi:hypothetical protein
MITSFISGALTMFGMKHTADRMPTPTERKAAWSAEKASGGHAAGRYGFYAPDGLEGLPVAAPGPWEGKERFVSRLMTLMARTAYDRAPFAPCPFCGQPNGAATYTANGVTWPAGYLHLIDDHNVIPAPEFVAAVMASPALDENLEF